MGQSFSLGGIDFGELGPPTTTGKYALDFKAGAGVEDLATYHVPGVKGSYTVSGDIMSRPIVARARYIAADVSALLSAVISDVQSLEGAAVDVDGDDGETYERCRLSAANRVSRVINTGRGTVRVDVEFSFTCYGG